MAEEAEEKVDIKTVGDLRRMLRYSDNEEPILFEVKTVLSGFKKVECRGVYSAAGGRMTGMWFE